MKREIIIFIDCGDTLVDESTQIMDEDGNVIGADLFEGAKDMLMELHISGYRIVLVADGRVLSFRNIFNQHGLSDCLEEWIISEELKVEKPHEIMFQTAMDKLELKDMDKDRIVMIGNNLKRDILGANEMGITSILISLSPRYVMQPESEDEIPDYVVSKPSELPPLLEQLEIQHKNKRILTKVK